jgi:hypothetical protein
MYGNGNVIIYLIYLKFPSFGSMLFEVIDEYHSFIVTSKSARVFTRLVREYNLNIYF